MSQAKPPAFKGDLAAIRVTNQLSTCGLTQAGSPVQTHPAKDPLVLPGERSRSK